MTHFIAQGDRSLMVQWMDVNQLSQEENLHSKCLCVNRLPLDLCDSEELTQLFSETYKPVFCQVSAFVHVCEEADKTDIFREILICANQTNKETNKKNPRGHNLLNTSIL